MTEKLKIGIIDLLTILLPGAFLLIVYEKKLRALITPEVTKQSLLHIDWIFAAMFLSAAYTLGHFIFFISSFLDDIIYEKVKKIYWQDHYALVNHVMKIKERETGIHEVSILSAFKWSTAYLMSKEPAIYGEVEKYMAESKFFRSLVVVLLLAALIIKDYSNHYTSLLLVLLLAFLSLVRYLTQRQKSLQTAYHGILTTCKKWVPGESNEKVITKDDQENLLLKVKLFRSMELSKNKNQWTNAIFYSLLKFFFALLLCIIPGLETFIIRSKKLKLKNTATSEM